MTTRTLLVEQLLHFTRADTILPAQSERQQEIDQSTAKT